MAAGSTIFLVVLDSLSDEDLDAATQLPGWTRRHVVAHVHDNAAALRRLVRWARTGERPPMYDGPEQRAAEIEAGSQLPAAELRSSVRASAAHLRLLSRCTSTAPSGLGQPDSDLVGPSSSLAGGPKRAHQQRDGACTTAAGGGGASVNPVSRHWTRSAPDRPSTIVWCALTTTAQRPPARPSTCHICHSGRLASRCGAMTCATRARSDWSPRRPVQHDAPDRQGGTLSRPPRSAGPGPAASSAPAGEGSARPPASPPRVPGTALGPARGPRPPARTRRAATGRRSPSAGRSHPAR